MSYRVIVTPTAYAEAMEAFRWYADRSPSASTKWLQGLTRALNGLANQPGRCPISEDDSEALGREVHLMLYGRRHGVFRILFEIDEDIVRVLRIWHSARGPLEP